MNRRQMSGRQMSVCLREGGVVREKGGGTMDGVETAAIRSYTSGVSEQADERRCRCNGRYEAHWLLSTALCGQGNHLLPTDCSRH